MTYTPSEEVLTLEAVAPRIRENADRMEKLAIAQGTYSEEMQALVASQREQADNAEAVAAWCRENEI